MSPDCISPNRTRLCVANPRACNGKVATQWLWWLLSSTIQNGPLYAVCQARNGERDTTPDDIMEMVKAQAAPQHRLILFLQQSSVEWASSLWMHVVQEVDPTFNRTVRTRSTGYFYYFLMAPPR